MDLNTAARRLGVHYQTAYRWVREGSLPAVKRGTSYDVDAAELDRFMAAHQAPAPPPRTTVVRAWGAPLERLHTNLVEGDELGARAVVDRLHAGGVDVVVLIEELLGPALTRIGHQWADGAISVAAEHRASAICERLLARMAVHPRGRPRGVALVSTPPGDEHGLPAVMAAIALRADRWRVHHLGTRAPVADLVAMAASLSADLVVLSVAYPAALPGAEDARGPLLDSGAHLLIGRPGEPLRRLVDQARQVPHAGAGG